MNKSILAIIATATIALPIGASAETYFHVRDQNVSVTVRISDPGSGVSESIVDDAISLAKVFIGRLISGSGASCGDTSGGGGGGKNGSNEGGGDNSGNGGGNGDAQGGGSNNGSGSNNFNNSGNSGSSNIKIDINTGGDVGGIGGGGGGTC